MQLSDVFGPDKVQQIERMIAYCASMEKVLEPQKAQAAHLKEEIIDSFLNENIEKAERRHLFLIAGLPGAGKSSVIADDLKKRHDAVLLDSDLIKEQIPLFGRGEGASMVHALSSEITSAIFGMCLDLGLNIVFPVVGRDEGALKDRIDMALAKKYRVHLVYVHVPVAVALQRVYKRWQASGRFVSPKYVLDLNNQPMETFRLVVEAYKERLGSYLMYDNDVDDGNPIALDSSRPYG